METETTASTEPDYPASCAHCDKPANEVDNIVADGDVYCDDDCADAALGAQVPPNLSEREPMGNRYGVFTGESYDGDLLR